MTDRRITVDRKHGLPLHAWPLFFAVALLLSPCRVSAEPHVRLHPPKGWTDHPPQGPSVSDPNLQRAAQDLENLLYAESPSQDAYIFAFEVPGTTEMQEQVSLASAEAKKSGVLVLDSGVVRRRGFNLGFLATAAESPTGREMRTIYILPAGTHTVTIGLVGDERSLRTWRPSLDEVVDNAEGLAARPSESQKFGNLFGIILLVGLGAWLYQFRPWGPRVRRYRLRLPDK